MLMVCKNQDASCAQLFLNKLKLNSLYFDRLCNECLRFRGSPKVGINGMGIRRRYIFLLSKAMVRSVENERNAVKSVGPGPRNARSA